MTGLRGVLSCWVRIALIIACSIHCGFLNAESRLLETLPLTEAGAETSVANLQSHVESVSVRYDQAVKSGNEAEAQLLAEVKRNIVNTIQTIAPETIVAPKEIVEQAGEPETHETFRQPVEQDIRVAQLSAPERPEDRSRCEDKQCEDKGCDRHKGGRKHHVRAAIRHLHAAGMHDVAERLRHLAKKGRDAHSDRGDHHPHPPHHKIARRLKHALGEIHEQMEEQAEGAEELEERLDEQAEGMHEFMEEAEEWAEGFEEHIGERAEEFGERVEELEERVESLVGRMEHMQRHLRQRFIEKAEKHDQRLRREAEKQRREAKSEMQRMRDQLRSEVEQRLEATEQ